jgi:hypothetical protein
MSDIQGPCHWFFLPYYPPKFTPEASKKEAFKFKGKKIMQITKQTADGRNIEIYEEMVIVEY